MKYRVTLNGKNYEVEVEQGEAQLINVTDATVAATPAVAAPAAAAPAAPAPAVSRSVAAGEGEPYLAPLPGTIVNVAVSAGAAVKKGQLLVVIEAMKMENEVVSPRDAVVTSVAVSRGQSVNTDDLLLTLK